MKNSYILSILFSMMILSLQAQFIDDLENCANDGDPIIDGVWTDWGCGGGVGCALVCSSDQAHSGSWSGLVPDDGTTDAVLNLGNKIFGTWNVTFWMYVPSGREAYWNLQGTVPIGSGEWIVGNIHFNKDNTNPGMGLIDDTALGEVTFIFPHDTWFSIRMSFDISAGIGASTWGMAVDFTEVIPSGTPFTDNAGTYPAHLGGINFFSISTDNWYYLDDFCFTDAPFFCEVLGVTAIYPNSFSIYPNPVKNILNLENKNNLNINSIKVFDISGKLVLQQEDQFDSLEVSKLKSGIYFLQLKTEHGKVTKKMIKE